MTRGFVVRTSLCVAVALTAISVAAGKDTLARQDPTWQPVWLDEFDTAGLPDSGRWSYEVGGHGWGNRELQFYTERRRENARVEGGRLIVEARREDWQGKQYTSARLNSRAGWTYGRIEVRAKLPRGRGTWPAIWMLPVHGEYAKGGWPDNGEIDIMEHVGFDPGVIHGTIHSRAYNHVDRTQRGGDHDGRRCPGRISCLSGRLDAAVDRGLRRQHQVFLVRQRASCESPGGLAAVAVRPGLPHPSQYCRRR